MQLLLTPRYIFRFRSLKTTRTSQKQQPILTSPYIDLHWNNWLSIFNSLRFRASCYINTCIAYWLNRTTLLFSVPSMINVESSWHRKTSSRSCPSKPCRFRFTKHRTERNHPAISTITWTYAISCHIVRGGLVLSSNTNSPIWTHPHIIHLRYWAWRDNKLSELSILIRKYTSLADEKNNTKTNQNVDLYSTQKHTQEGRTTY